MSVLAKNITYNILGQGIVVMLGFVAVKFIYSSLGADALGIIYFSFLINSVLFGILEKGIYSTTVREISKNIHTDKEYSEKLIQTGTMITWGAFFLFVIIVYLLVPLFVEKWITFSFMKQEEVVVSLQILALSSLVAFPTSFYASLLRGIQRMGYTNIIDVVLTAIQQIGILVVINYSGDFIHVVIWIATSYMLKLAAYFSVCTKFFTIKSFLPIYSKTVIERNSKFTVNMIYMSILAMIYKQSDKLALSKLQPVGVLGYYGFAYNAISKATMLTMSISNAAYPSLCELSEEADKPKLMERYRVLQELMLFINVPIFFSIVYASLPLFEFVFDSNVSEKLFYPTIILCLGFYINGSLSLPYRLVLAKGKSEIAVKQDLYALLFILPFVIFLVFQFGITGAASGLLLYMIFGCFYMIPRLYRECIFERSGEFYILLIKMLILAFISYGLIFVFMYNFYAMEVINILVAYCIASILFLIMSFSSMSKVLKKKLVAQLNSASKFILR